ncbi:MULTISPECIES: phosphoribosyl-AMP cyclohydrolase [unclassified Rhizobium]|uniref:phosphoribosyl-AMP cyclohydrolase n=1 Tax=unclassified Rhizobium TaxID=2613769 RepID=UPI001AD982A9|nr:MULTISPECIES: phosphoribosyl-AMP cyclohydrolase [unclassified Rhizobium]MBO9098439.1 phosphoribosyl-AMP cyclohydrolase [Rhizobium sp. L58/93]MBO9132757.1 phosphoribosyl-AMP cyclohydrolase [Rhizobium sp. B209b/85]MBO9168705.1 phosphoribosyl-AMP cyclohydrolase [Rhizobium sp. L245/93]MBO9184655.1 phosphoribosyl-AMP cyclohydrolase [Rhizobium sp. E27B/91]QXZ84835.1 phosphoribosyl-AMP cyclohydrolase [Rhizobium sp. K1/93]
MIGFREPSRDKAELEDDGEFTPRFDDGGLITAVVTDASDGVLLMVAHMNAEALSLTLSTGIAHYYSRSRAKIWKKGETSGNLQTVMEIRTDCDQDAILLKVEVGGHAATCHTGRRSCFYRVVELQDGKPVVRIVDTHRHFDPRDVYGH